MSANESFTISVFPLTTVSDSLSSLDPCFRSSPTGNDDSFPLQSPLDNLYQLVEVEGFRKDRYKVHGIGWTEGEMVWIGLKWFRGVFE